MFNSIICLIGPRHCRSREELRRSVSTLLRGVALNSHRLNSCLFPLLIVGAELLAACGPGAGAPCDGGGAELACTCSSGARGTRVCASGVTSECHCTAPRGEVCSSQLAAAVYSDVDGYVKAAFWLEPRPQQPAQMIGVIDSGDPVILTVAADGRIASGPVMRVGYAALPTAAQWRRFRRGGDPELAVVVRETPGMPWAVQFYSPSADGQAVEMRAAITGATDGHAIDLSSADVDGNGTLDLAVTILEPSGAIAFHFLMNDGQGTFALSPESNTIDQTLHPTTCSIVDDVNHDGLADARCALSGHAIQILLQRDGRFTGVAGIDTISGTMESTSLGTAMGDWDGDGNVDVAGFAPTHLPIVPVIVVARGDGAGGFTDTMEIESPWAIDPANPPVPRRIAAVDLNCDNRLDLLVSADRGFVSETFALINDGSGHFSTAMRAGNGSVFPAGAVGDVNADGLPDFALENILVNRDSIGIIRGVR